MNLDLNQPGALDALLAFHKSRFGDARMSVDDSALGAQTGDTVTVTVPPTPAPTPPAFDEEAFMKSPAVIALLENARKQEKDKLYPQLNELKSQVENLTSSRQAEIDAAAEKARKAAEEEARKRFEESDAKSLLQQKDQEWEARFNALQEERAQERAALEKERAFLELSQYTQSAVQRAIDAGEIAPELAPHVMGNNVDEVNASLENVKATSAAIVANMQAAMQAQQPAPRGVSATGLAPVGPMDMAGGTRTLSASDIANMPMAEYARLRSQLGTARESSNVGLFGR